MEGRSLRSYDDSQSFHIDQSKIVCHCRSRERSKLSELAICDICGTRQHSKCILANPTNSGQLDPSDCMNCCELEMENIRSAALKRVETLTGSPDIRQHSNNRKVDSEVAAEGYEQRSAVAPISHMSQSSIQSPLDKRIMSPLRSKHQQIQPASTLEPSTLEQSPETGRQQNVCTCEKPCSPDGEDFTPCDRCSNLQHVHCMVNQDGSDQEPSLHLCNQCRIVKLERQIASQNEDIEDLREAVHKERIETYGLHTDQLWEHYCNLPNGSASDIIIAATQTRYRHGRLVPVYCAPHNWADEVQRRLRMMMDAAGDELAIFISDSKTSDEQGFTRSLAQWQSLALWMIHHGPYKGKRSALGLLAEVLGLEGKGTFWRGKIIAAYDGC